MTRPDMTKSSGKLWWATIVAALPLSVARVGHAEESCTLRGDVAMPKGVTVSDAAGTDIAQFTGAKVTIALSGFGAGSGNRVKIQTSGFRIDGYVRSREVPVYTVRSVPAYAGHVWIAEGRRVSIIGAGPGKLQAEKSVTSPINGTFRGWAPCESFTLTERVPSGWNPSGSERGYTMRRDRIDLYSSERGEIVTAIQRGDGNVLLWSSDGTTGGWVHVEFHGDILFDGYVRASDVSALPPGETMDQLAPSPIQRGSPTLSAAGMSKVVHVDHPVPLRMAASDAAVPVGTIEASVDVMVLDIVAGWASVLPKALTISPAGTSQFWVRAKDLGL